MLKILDDINLFMYMSLSLCIYWHSIYTGIVGQLFSSSMMILVIKLRS